MELDWTGLVDWEALEGRLEGVTLGGGGYW